MTTKIFSKKQIVTLVITSLILFSNSLYSQKYRETFRYGSPLNGWVMKNNTEPRPAAENTWVQESKAGYLGAEDDAGASTVDAIKSSTLSFLNRLNSFGVFNPLASNAEMPMNYLVTGYSENDYDNATISNWLISPQLYHLKNGDTIRFRTKQLTKSGADYISSVMSGSIDGLLQCDRPNKLEVRMSKKEYGEPNVGSGAEDVGDFDILLHTINPNLTVNGYPGSWTDITVVVQGLPYGKMIAGRIAFRYYVPNAGYDNCQVRKSLPPAASFALARTAEVVGEASGHAGTAVSLIEPTYNIISATTQTQLGKNGTYIGIDDFRHYPIDVFLKDLGDDKDFINNFIHVGYAGTYNCNNPNFFKPTRTFSLYNNRSTPITVEVDFTSGTHNAMFELKTQNVFTIQPGKVEKIIVGVKDIGEIQSTFTGTTFLTIKEQNDPLILEGLRFVLEDSKPPIANCVSGIKEALLDPNTGIGTIDLNELDAGSIDGCGGKDYKLGLQKYSWGYPKGTFNCSDINPSSSYDTYYLVVENNSVSSLRGKRSVCPVKIKVVPPSAPVIDCSGSPTQYYLQANQADIPVNALVPPTVTSLCGATVTLSSLSIESISYPGNYTNMGASQNIGIGNYRAIWKAEDNGRKSSYCTVYFEVIDTIKPYANCRDSVEIGYTEWQYNDWAIKTKIKGIDFNSSSHDNTKKVSYEIATTWNGNGGVWKNSIDYTCVNAGSNFPVTIKVKDNSGNYRVCNSIAKIKSPDKPTCRNIEINLDPTTVNPNTTGIKFIEAGDLLENGGDGICGIYNSTVSQNSFTCADVNQTIPVTVSYYDATNTERTCVSQVTVKEYSETEICEDSIILYVPASSIDLKATYEIKPPLTSVCSGNLSFSAVSTGAENFNLSGTGSIYTSLAPGASTLTRTANYLSNSYTCTQTVMVYDTIPPQTTSTPSNTTLNLASLVGNYCTYEHEIVNPFLQGSYLYWTYELTGDTKEYKKFHKDVTTDYYWQNKTVNLNPGTTTITLIAVDLVGNTTELTYDFALNVVNPTAPSVVSDEMNDNPFIVGDFCGEDYYYNISSPVFSPCDFVTYKWFYEVRDGYMGNIVYQKDSIHQDSGAMIPIKISPQMNQSYNRTVHFGYHGLTYGGKNYTWYKSIQVIDTAGKIECNNDTIIEYSNTSTFTYDYTIKPPKGACSGGFWGYEISGATNIKSEQDNSVSYNNNQTVALGYETPIPYPIFPMDSSVTVTLNNGINFIKLLYIEESGNISDTCVFEVRTIDTTTPAISCPSDVTIHRTNPADCFVPVGGACQQITGFTGPYGVSGIGKLGGNSSIKLDKSNMPNSVSFISKQTRTSLNDAYIAFRINCSGTFSFNWEYQSDFPNNFRPFIYKNKYDPNEEFKPEPSGFSTSTTGVQTGTYSVSVDTNDVIIIGLNEGGKDAGYFKISNLSAPYTDITANIPEPTFSAHPILFYEPVTAPKYNIGEHEAQYILTNSNNGKQSKCFQKITVIDDFTATLACNNDTLYLDEKGIGVAKVSDYVSSCFPVSATTLSKDTFNCADIGNNIVTITSVDKNNDTLTCTPTITVLDTIPPKIENKRIRIDLDNSDNGTLNFAQLNTFVSDNCGVDTIYASQTTFGCNDAGVGEIIVTAIDVNGNSSNQNIVIEVYPSNFSITDPTTEQTVCEGENIVLISQSGGGGISLDYQWQRKEKDDSKKPWNFYSCDATTEVVKYGTQHQFVRLKINQYHDYQYMSYILNNTIYFRVLDTLTQMWNPVFSPISISTLSASSKSRYYFNLYESDNAPYVAYLNSAGSVVVMRYALGQWTQTNPTIFNTINQDFNDLYGNDGYFYAVKWDGKIHAAAEHDNGGISYIWNSIYNGPQSFNTYISVGENIVGVRNTLNQNMFYQLNKNASGTIISRDSLTNDPTGNSDVFSLDSYNGTPYIAYKSTNGKACVKKYDGADTWSTVGNLDFSANNITKINIGEVEDTLYAIYAEGSDSIRVKKFNGSNWVSMENPNDNMYIASVNNIEMLDIAGVPAFNIDHRGAAKNIRLIRNDGWHNVGTNANYSPNTDSASDETYRVIASKNGCARTTSGNKRIVVKDIPTLTVTSDYTFYSPTTVNLNGATTSGTINWSEDFNANSIVGNGTNYTTPKLYEHSIYYAHATNGMCYSDTLPVRIFINDDTIINKKPNHTDTICSGESAQIWYDTIHNFKYGYSLYEKDTNGVFVNTQPNSPNIAFNYLSWWINPTKTTEYKIKIEETNLSNPDAAAMSSIGGYPTEHFNFGDRQLNIQKEVTIEAWINKSQYATNPSYSIGHSYRNGQTYDPNSTKNWEWVSNYFKVYNGNSVRTLAFPNLPGNPWTHVATTADSSGLSIYYDGVLVASSNDTSSLNINNNLANLNFGTDAYGTKLSSLYGMDEFRVWSTKRTASEVAQNMDTCLTGFEEGLLIYQDFSTYTDSTNEFTSVTGEVTTLEDIYDPNLVPQTFRTGACGDTYMSEAFTDAFTVYVLNGESQITNIEDYYSSSTGFCGSEEITLVATASNGGTVEWYDSEFDGNLVGTGDTLRIFVDKDTFFYAQAAGSPCERFEAVAEVNGTPKITDIYVDTPCNGYDGVPTLYDFNVDADYIEADDYYLYFDSVGEIPIDDYYTEFPETDTIYIEAYVYDYDGDSILCRSERLPVTLFVRQPQITSFSGDTTLCHPDSVTFTATGSGGVVEWWDEYDQDLLHTGDTFTTPYLQNTTHYLLYVYNESSDCWSQGTYITAEISSNPERYDTIISCAPITWIDGNTYSQSDTSIEYYKNNGTDCDSLIHLNLTIIDINDINFVAQEYSLCTGDSTSIILNNTQVGSIYTIYDTSNNSVFAGPITGNGQNIPVQTGAINMPTGFTVEVSKTESIGSKSLTCSKYLSDTITIEIGEVRSSRTAITCGNYIWLGNTYNTSGTYYDTLPSASGCDSIITLNLTVNSPSSYTENITACDSLIWHGTTYHASTNTPTWVTYNTTGCDSTVTLNLTIINSVITDTIAVACDSFAWNNTTYYQSGTYFKTLTGNNTCDSTVRLNLTINGANNPIDVYVTSCDSLVWENTTYYTSGDYIDTLSSSIGCDSVVNLHLTINHSNSGFETITACDSIVWNGNTYNTTGTYYDTLTNIVGCDSIVTLNLMINTFTTSDTTATVCSSILWRGNLYNTTGNFNDTINNVNGCDSIITLHLTVNQPNTGDTTAVACSSFAWRGNSYSTSGDYTATLTNVNGCDSVVTLHLTINQPNTGDTTAVACNSFAWRGNSYSASGDYTTTLVNADGCDSVVTLHLTINQPNTGDTTAVACNTYNWYGSTYSSSGDYTTTLTNSGGCDSIVTLHLTISQQNNDTTATACGSFNWRGNSYSSTGAYDDTVGLSVNGCDSIVTLHLTINQPNTGDTTAVACSSFAWRGNSYSASGDYTTTLTNASGCDSVVTLHLTINQPNTGDTTAVACSSFAWKGNSYSASGDYTATLTNASGCDSVVTLHLTINQPNTGDTTAVACSSFAWRGNSYSASGDYTATLTNVNGCDSLVTLHLTINQPNTGDTTAVACSSFAWRGNSYSASGDYTATLTNASGCDSVVTLHLTINQPNTGDTTAVACSSFAWRGNSYSASGDYTATLTNASGCDSLVTLHLTINQPNTGDTTAVACSSFAWRGNSYSASGDYTTTLTNASGCDSVVTLHLTINQPNTGDTTTVACSSFAWKGNSYSASGDYTATLTNASGCDSVVTLHLTINQPNTGDTTAVACSSFAWRGNSYSASGDYTTTLTNASGCDSVVTLHLTINQPNTGDTTAVACSSFAWRGNSYSASGDYMATLTNASGCDSVVTLHLTVNNVDTNITVTSDSLVATQSNASYQWISCSNNSVVGTNQVFFPTLTDDYYVVITYLGCIDSSSCYNYTDSNTTNIIGNIPKEVKVYPNPVNDLLWIDLGKNYSKTMIVVTDYLGKAIMKETISQEKLYSISLNGLATGTYHIVITTEDFTAPFKIIKY